MLGSTFGVPPVKETHYHLAPDSSSSPGLGFSAVSVPQQSQCK